VYQGLGLGGLGQSPGGPRKNLCVMAEVFYYFDLGDYFLLVFECEAKVVIQMPVMFIGHPDSIIVEGADGFFESCFHMFTLV
jgi:hypothetical protein